MSSKHEKDETNVIKPVNQPRYILAPFVPSPESVVEQMLQLTEVTDRDTLYDLGCGDGRIVITAAREYGARGVGVDIEPYWVAESEANAKKHVVEQLVEFRLEDALTVDLTNATVVTLYLVHWSTAKLQPIIRDQVKPGTRIVSNNYGMGDWPPDRTEKYVDADGNNGVVNLWIV